jgi:hypothetical protein
LTFLYFLCSWFLLLLMFFCSCLSNNQGISLVVNGSYFLECSLFDGFIEMSTSLADSLGWFKGRCAWLSSCQNPSTDPTSIGQYQWLCPYATGGCWCHLWSWGWCIQAKDVLPSFLFCSALAVSLAMRSFPSNQTNSGNVVRPKRDVSKNCRYQQQRLGCSPTYFGGFWDTSNSCITNNIACIFRGETGVKLTWTGCSRSSNIQNQWSQCIFHSWLLPPKNVWISSHS